MHRLPAYCVLSLAALSASAAGATPKICGRLVQDLPVTQPALPQSPAPWTATIESTKLIGDLRSKIDTLILDDQKPTKISFEKVGNTRVLQPVSSKTRRDFGWKTKVNVVVSYQDGRVVETVFTLEEIARTTTDRRVLNIAPNYKNQN